MCTGAQGAGIRWGATALVCKQRRCAKANGPPARSDTFRRQRTGLGVLPLAGWLGGMLERWITSMSSGHGRVSLADFNSTRTNLSALLCPGVRYNNCSIVRGIVDVTSLVQRRASMLGSRLNGQNPNRSVHMDIGPICVPSAVARGNLVCHVVSGGGGRRATGSDQILVSNSRDQRDYR